MFATRARAITLTSLTLLAALLAAFLAPTPAKADEAPKILLVLDVSGSMNSPISSGGTKFAAAKRALKQVASSLPAGTQVGLRVYGSKISEPKSKNPKACTDTELVLPIGPLNRSKMYKAVDSFKAVGETPIAYSLGKAVDDLGDSGKRVVVLISDGEETCAKDPCPTARKLADKGVDLQFNAVGLAVGAKARKQLTCIADAGGGSYYDASRTGDLTEALRKITQRALRPFQVSGTPVKGTEDQESAPPLSVGQYTDRYDRSETTRYYKINRTPGSSVSASVASITNPKDQQSAVRWQLSLATPEGVSCASKQINQSSYRDVTVVAGAVSAWAENAAVKPECLSAPVLIFGLSRGIGLVDSATAPVEIIVAEEPPIANLDSLPESVSSYNGRGKAVKAGKAKTVVGGSAFSNAPAVEPGSIADSVAIGETVFYRVRLEPGQKVRASAEFPWPGRTAVPANAGVNARMRVFAPLRQELGGVIQSIGSGRTRLTVASPEVRVRNRELKDLDEAQAAAVAGDYYVGVQITSPGLSVRGQVVPIRVSFAVDGTPTGLPEYADASISPSPSTSAPTSGGPSATAPPTGTDPSSAPTEAPSSDRSPLLPIVIIGVAILAVIGLSVAILRRRGRARG